MYASLLSIAMSKLCVMSAMRNDTSIMYTFVPSLMIDECHLYSLAVSLRTSIHLSWLGTGLRLFNLVVVIAFLALFA